MTSEVTQPPDDPPRGFSVSGPTSRNLAETPALTAGRPETTAGRPETAGVVKGPPPERTPAPVTRAASGVMPVHIFVLAVIYLAALMAVFVMYFTWPAFRSDIPAAFGQLPVGVVWFGAIGAEIASLYGIFVHNREWDPSYNYWHYCRPLFGAVTGSIGAIIYLILLNLGNKSAVKVDTLTFYVVAFVLGFADRSFIQLLQNVTKVIIKPGGKA